MPRANKCPDCDGTGEVYTACIRDVDGTPIGFDYIDCESCGGTGRK